MLAQTGDMTPPLTTIASGPEAQTASTTATFAFSADEAGVTFRCSLDGAPLTFCDSPKEYTDIAPGDHVFEVHAFKAHLLVDPEPAVWQWTVPGVGRAGARAGDVRGREQRLADPGRGGERHRP